MSSHYLNQLLPQENISVKCENLVAENLVAESISVSNIIVTDASTYEAVAASVGINWSTSITSNSNAGVITSGVLTLAANTSAVCIVNNDKILSNNDLVICSISGSHSSTGEFFVNVVNVSTGAFSIRLTNVSSTTPLNGAISVSYKIFPIVIVA